MSCAQGGSLSHGKSSLILPSLSCQEQHDRLLILYPSTLVIVSEERNGLYFKASASHAPILPRPLVFHCHEAPAILPRSLLSLPPQSFASTPLCCDWASTIAQGCCKPFPMGTALPFCKSPLPGNSSVWEEIVSEHFFVVRLVQGWLGGNPTCFSSLRPTLQSPLQPLLTHPASDCLELADPFNHRISLH